MRPQSITFRLTVLFASASTAVLLVVGYLIGAAVDRHLETQDLTELNGKLELVRHALAKVHTPSDLTALPPALSDALVGHHGLSIAIVGPERRVLFSSPGAVFPEALPTTDGLPATPPLQRWEQHGRSYHGIIATTPTGSAAMGPTTVIVALDIGHHLEFIAAFRETLWIAITAGIVLTVLLGWIVARRGLAPLHHMANISHGISASRLGERLPLDAVPAELTALASAFNAMLARLEDSFRRLSDFASDLAHELRTPISNLMTQTQVALARARTADEYREVLYSNLEEYDRLARMIADMLFLAKADHGLIVPRSEDVDLAAEVHALFEFYEAFAEERGVGLTCSGAGHIAGDKLMMRRALSNLLSNAITHTPRRGGVTINIIDADADVVRLSIENPGETIPAEHLPRLFDRFYRADASRQQSSDGAGLGLAITQSIIAAHQGTIQAFSAEGVTRFEITLPTAAANTNSSTLNNDAILR